MRSKLSRSGEIFGFASKPHRPWQLHYKYNIDLSDAAKWPIKVAVIRDFGTICLNGDHDQLEH